MLLTPECALVGYPGAWPAAARADLVGVDWCLVGDLEDDLAIAAERAGILLVLGTASPDARRGADPGRITNDALACGAVAPVRYRKRQLTPGDRDHFISGGAPALVDHAGWRLGLGICYDLRFAKPWRDLARAGADAFLCIAHMAGPDPDPGVKAAVVPQFAAVRAAEWATPVLFANTAADDRWLDSGHWDARGVRMASGDGAGSMTTTLLPRSAHEPWYAGIRDQALGTD